MPEQIPENTQEDVLEAHAAEIARDHFTGKTFADIGKQYNCAASTVQRRFQKWLDEKRFEISEKSDNEPSQPEIVTDVVVEDHLVENTQIQARVVLMTGAERACNEDFLNTEDIQTRQMSWKASDELHEKLREIAAVLIEQKLKAVMNIGLASGRGVGFAVAKLGELAEGMPSRFNRYENSRLISMCGGAHVGKWASTSSDRPLDADENVFVLASILNVPKNSATNIIYNSGPIAVSLAKNRAIPDIKYELDLAIIGLGMLNSGHHYFRFIDNPELKAIAEPLRRIKEMQSKDPALVERVAEIVHRLYPIGDEPLPPEFLADIAEINRSINAVAPEKIKNAREVILIAGGRQKLKALYHLLYGEFPDLPINKCNLTLVTDSCTAQEIIRLKMSKK